MPNNRKPAKAGSTYHTHNHYKEKTGFWPPFFKFLLVISSLYLFFLAAFYGDHFRQFTNWLMTSLTWLGIILLAAGALVGATLLTLTSFTKRQQYNRQIRGSYAIREYQLDPLPVRIWRAIRGKPMRRAVYKPDNDPGVGVIVDERGLTPLPVMDAQAQLAYAGHIEARRRIQAAVSPNDDLGKTISDASFGIPNANTGKFLSGQWGPKDKPLTPRIIGDEPKETKALPAQPRLLTLSDALSTAPKGEMPLGQRKNGELALWNPEADPHLGIYGKSKSGKSRYAGFTTALSQLRRGHVVCLDPEGGVDWSHLAPQVEVIPIDLKRPSRAPFEALLNEMERRSSHLKQHGASNMYHANGHALEPLYLHFEEYGAFIEKLSDAAKAGDEHAGEVLAYANDVLKQIAMRGARTAIHLTIYAQLPTDIPTLVESNLVTLTFKQGAKHGNTVGYWHAHELGSGEFAFEGERYQAWVAQNEASQILRQLPTRPRLLANLAAADTGRAAGAGHPGAPRGDAASANKQWRDVTHVERDRYGDVIDLAPPEAEPLDETTIKQQLTDQYFEEHPEHVFGPVANGAISGLARLFAVKLAGDPGHYRTYKSEAHKAFHGWRESVSVPEGRD